MNGGTALSGIGVVNYTMNPRFRLPDGYTWFLCLLVAYMIGALPTSGRCVKSMLINCSPELQRTSLKATAASSAKPRTSNNKLYSRINMIYDSRIIFNQIVFRRNKKEGNYYAESQPFYVPLETIDTFTNGELHRTEGDVVYVEEDVEQIQALINAKLVEAEEYNAAMRQLDKTGIEPGEMDIA